MAWFPLLSDIGTRLKIYKWIAGFKRGRKCNIENLERACRNNLQKHKNDPKSNYCPWKMSLEDAEAKAASCKQEMELLREEAPTMRTNHLRTRINQAREKGDKNKEKGLLTMLRKEHDRKQDGRLRTADMADWLYTHW